MVVFVKVINCRSKIVGILQFKTRARFMLVSIKHEVNCITKGPDPGVVNLFSFSTQLSMRFQLLITKKILKNNGMFCFQTLRYVFIMLINIKLPTVIDILTFMA